MKLLKLRIRDLREDNDLTQKQVANLLYLSQNAYSRYECGGTLPLEAASVLADFYNTSLDYLSGRTDVKQPYPPAKEGGGGARGRAK